jgi:prolyl oligopeptidase
LHALRAGSSYPAALILTGDHDDRAGDAAVLLRIEKATGHGLGKPKRVVVAEYADMLAFAAENTGLAPV